jgi:hypothetical protein
MISRRTVLGGLCSLTSLPTLIATAEVASYPIDVGNFGFRLSPADNCAAQEAMRRHAIANPGSIYRFPPGTYDLVSSRFLYGVRDIEVWAYEARFRNTKAGTFGYSDANAAFYIGSGSFFHPMGSADIDPRRASSGAYIHDAAAGSKTVRLIAPAMATEFRTGTWAVVHWLSRQQQSFPPNPAYFEYVRVVAADAVGGVLTLDRPLQFSYKSLAPDALSDSALYNTATGPARILSLERPDYQVCERFVLRGGAGIVTGFGKSPPDPYDGILEIAGAIDVEVHDVAFEGFFPTMVRSVKVVGSTFPNISELDKIIETIELSDCTVADIAQGAGVRSFCMRGGALTSSGRRPWKSEIRAHTVRLERVEIVCQNPNDGGAQLGIDAYAKALVEIDGCTFRPHARQRAALAPGDGVVLTADAVTGSSITVAAGNPAMEGLLYAIDIGTTISRVSGAHPGIFTVGDISFTPGGDLVLSGSFDEGGPGEHGGQRIVRSIRRLIDSGNNHIVSPPPGYRMLPPTRVIAEPRQGSEQGSRVFRFEMNAAERLGTPIQGYVTSLIVDVVDAYRGGDGEIALEIGRSGPGPVHDLGRIDVRVAGRRSVTRTGVFGCTGGDRWKTPLPKALWIETLVLHLQGDQPSGLADAASAALPRIAVEMTAA